eukprot:GHVU01153181.1.p1 GENE.GHVU01153181.1~~GHVU01153181.1.p1  ORF type:complete len:390 (-),score=32.49 GHVU01153181.1:958-2127(-)
MCNSTKLALYLPVVFIFLGLLNINSFTHGFTKEINKFLSSRSGTSARENLTTWKQARYKLECSENGPCQILLKLDLPRENRLKKKALLEMKNLKVRENEINKEESSPVLTQISDMSKRLQQTLQDLHKLETMWKERYDTDDSKNPPIAINIQNTSSHGSKPISNLPQAPVDCADLYKKGETLSGSYEIQLDQQDLRTRFSVSCDMETDGGGWTIIQRRQDGSVNFERNWHQYKHGFGDSNGEYWLGLEKIHLLNSHGNWRLRFDLWDFDGNHVYAEYERFRLGRAAENYHIRVGAYRGTAGDGFHYGVYPLRPNNMKFTTLDKDNDKSHYNCAELYNGGWWYNNCMVINLNGIYYTGGHYNSRYRNGIVWTPWTHASLKRTEIKVKPHY